MNKVLLVGRLTRDPEQRNTTTGNAIASFSIAINRPFKNREGVIEADFINVSIFGKQAENVMKYCTKGMQVGVEGSVRTRSYEAQDGTKRYVFEVQADRVEFLSSKKDSETSYGGGYMDAPSSYESAIDAPSPEANEVTIPTADPYENFGEEISLSDNDLPF